MATENASMSVDELFDGTGGDAGAPETPASAEGTKPETRDDGRDARGRFQAAIDAADKSAAQTKTGDTSVLRENADIRARNDLTGEADPAAVDGQIPAWRLREIREERDRIRAEADRDREELRRLRASLAARETKERDAARRREMPDMYGDPDGYTEFLREDTRTVAEQIREEMRDQRIDLTFADQHEAFPEEFPKAYQALRQARNNDDPVAERVMNAPNPGKALMRWYRDGEALREIGGDLAGWRQKEQDRLLKDPEFRKKAAAAWAAEAGGEGGTGDGGTVVMMPSLNRATGSRGSPSQGGMRNTEEFTGLFNGNGRKRPA